MNYTLDLLLLSLSQLMQFMISLKRSFWSNGMEVWCHCFTATTSACPLLLLFPDQITVNGIKARLVQESVVVVVVLFNFTWGEQKQGH